jgi:ABC-type sugar transport system ATPase subunit
MTSLRSADEPVVEQTPVPSVGASTGGPAPAPLLELRGVKKRYGGVHALRGADLTVSRPGSVMGLLGENGSGKSTLLNVLSGQARPDEGAVLMDGRPLRLSTPRDAIDAGIALVSQETAIAADLTVAENVLMGRLPRRRGAVSWSETRAQAREVLARLRLDYDVRAPLRELRPDQRQMVEIARALSMDARVLVLDEPTSSLTEEEATSLFLVVKELSVNGVATILVSHRLAEMFATVDELTILRDGRTASAGPIRDYDADRVVRDMTGREPHAAGIARAAELDPSVAPVLELADVRSGSAVRGVDLELRPGRIIGIAGLVGAGRSELLETLFGVRRRDGGTVRYDGREVDFANPRQAIDAGFAFLPPERKTQGLVLPMAIGDNLTMVETGLRHRFARPSGSAAMAAIDEARRTIGLRAQDPQAAVKTLSGGNQQKVALGKWLRMTPRVLLLDDPTRGVDVAAKREIHQMLRHAADNGSALLVSSSENQELLELCDEIVVMVRGRLVSTLRPEDVTETELTQMSGGHQ